MQYFLFISGIVFWGILIVVISVKMLFGEDWLKKFGIHFFSLKELNNSVEQLIREAPNNIKDTTVARISAALFWRITRIGLLTVIVTMFPIILLFRQNQLISSQNKLFELQNEKVEQQTKLFNSQNKLFAKQTRPYIIIEQPTELARTIVRNYNAPAYVDSLVISYYLKDFGDNPFVLIDKQIDKNFKLYGGINENSGMSIKSNMLSSSFIKSTVKKNQRLKRVTKVYYTNLSDELNDDIKTSYYFERIDFLSKINEKWYMRTESENDENENKYY